MGRRSINTTKSGKYMNPTDQARKEARKKELKKNKRQRQMVRQTVLKNKDPSQLLEEMEKIDEMEYNVMQDSILNEKVCRDKRRKLKETFDRVMRVYHSEEPEMWADLKRREVEYEKKRLKKEQYYESVKHAQSVQIDEIPLPQMNTMPTPGIPQQRVPPPMNLSIPPFSVGGTKKPTDSSKTDSKTDLKKKEIPGCPFGPAPSLFDLSDLDTDAEDDPPLIKTKDGKISKPNALQQRMLAISGQSIDEFMKEKMKNVRNNKGDNSDDENDSEKEEDNSDTDISHHSTESDDSEEETTLPPIPGVGAIPGAALVIPHPHPMIFRPPPLRPGIPNFSIRMPPGPPPGPRPGAGRMGIRMPPVPPPGMPPRMMHHHKSHHPSKDLKGITTITAKPQIRNLSADVTRFVPSALRVKKEEGRKPKKPNEGAIHGEPIRGVNKDDAYNSFMREMQGLL